MFERCHDVLKISYCSHLHSDQVRLKDQNRTNFRPQQSKHLHPLTSIYRNHMLAMTHQPSLNYQKVRDDYSYNFCLMMKQSQKATPNKQKHYMSKLFSFCTFCMFKNLSMVAVRPDLELNGILVSFRDFYQHRIMQQSNILKMCAMKTQNYYGTFMFMHPVHQELDVFKY